MKTKVIGILAILAMIIAVAFYSCKKDEEFIRSTIEGQVLVWGTNEPIEWESAPPIVWLFEKSLLSGAGSVNFPQENSTLIARIKTDDDGKFKYETELIKERCYCMEVFYFTESKYFGTVAQELQYAKKQQVNPMVLAKAWASPRFIKKSRDPADTLFYLSGIGNISAVPLPITANDTLCNWNFLTWGGPDISATQKHVVKAIISRNGERSEVEISYFIEPGAKADVEIKW